MRDEPRTWRTRRLALSCVGLLLLTLGAPTVFSQGSAPSVSTSATAEKDPLRELLLLKKEAIQAEIKAAEARVDLATRQFKYAQSSNRAHLQSDDYVFNAEADLLEREAVVARKRAELKETTSRIEGYHRTPPQEGSTVDVTDDLLRRIKDLEARVEKIEGGGR